MKIYKNEFFILASSFARKMIAVIIDVYITIGRNAMFALRKNDNNNPAPSEASTTFFRENLSIFLKLHIIKVM